MQIELMNADETGKLITLDRAPTLDELQAWTLPRTTRQACLFTSCVGLTAPRRGRSRTCTVER